jgi:hypothetical protein
MDQKTIKRNLKRALQMKNKTSEKKKKESTLFDKIISYVAVLNFILGVVLFFVFFGKKRPKI